MKTLISSLLITASFALLAASCDREDPEPIGGKGGNATLLVTPKHHGANIDTCTVYIKYNTLDKPTGSYDDSVKCVKVNGKPVATFSGLKKGKYYLFGKGWDPGIVDSVEGGAPYAITNETTLEYDLAVTEGD